MNILLVGCGTWGEKILRELCLLGCTVHITDTAARAREAALGAGARSAGERLPDGLKPDGIVIATPASVHRQSVESVLTYGVPVFVEKPMTVSSRDARAICAMGGPPVFVMHTWRYHPGVRCLARIAGDRELGRPLVLRTIRCNWTSPRTDVDPVWTLLPHDVSIALEILGAIPTPVFAAAEMLGGRPVGLLGLLEHEELKMIVEVSTRYTDKRREVHLRCEGGVADLPNDRDGWVGILRNEDRMGAVERRCWPTHPGALNLELKAFVDYLNGGAEPKCNAETGARVVETVEELRALAGIS
ncbi:MAG: Gfo/Idh/MocA family oxidoreductase [Arenicellales bacterium]